MGVVNMLQKTKKLSRCLKYMYDVLTKINKWMKTESEKLTKGN